MKQPTQSYASIFSFPDLRKRLLLVAMMFIVYAIGTHIPISGASTDILKKIFGGEGILGILDLFTGGSLGNLSIFALGVIPYINASIAMQVLTFSIPYLEELQKEQGEEGRRKIGLWTRYLAVCIAFFQSYLLLELMRREGVFQNQTTLHAIYTVLSLVGGTCFLMWLGEQITNHGIGDGISLIIFASIVIRLPVFVGQQLRIMRLQHESAGKLISTLLFLIVMIGVIVFVELAVRKIPVKYARRGAFFMPYGGQSAFLPIKVNLGGVIPIIFAITFVSLFSPQFPLISLLRQKSEALYSFFVSFYASIWYIPAFALLIIFFNHFYSAIIFKPDEIADNLKNSGGFIPGVRPGEQTRDYIARIQEKITWIGGVFLAIVGILPLIFGRAFNIQGLPVSGTGILILVGVALDLIRQLEAHIVSRHYEGFIR
jgi:preprotein translocase subunit SecY